MLSKDLLSSCKQRTNLHITINLLPRSSGPVNLQLLCDLRFALFMEPGKKSRFSERYPNLMTSVRKSVETVFFYIQIHISPQFPSPLILVFNTFLSSLFSFLSSALVLSLFSYISLSHKPSLPLPIVFFHSSYYSSGVSIGEVFPAVSLSCAALGAVKQAPCLTEMGQQRGKLNLHLEPVLTKTS